MLNRPRACDDDEKTAFDDTESASMVGICLPSKVRSVSWVSAQWSNRGMVAVEG
jgi:hypothetical protein